MTKCKPPIFGDSAVLKKGLWVTLVIALVLALYGALFAPTWQTRAFTIDAAAQTHLHPLTDGETFTLPLPDGDIREISLSVTALSSESGGTATLTLTQHGTPVFTQTALLSDSTIRENLTFSLETADVDELVLTFSGNALPALGMSGDNQPCIRLSGTRPARAMLYYGIFAAVLVFLCVWESLFTARCAATGRQNHLLRLQAGIRRYGFLIEQLVRRNFNTKYRQSILGVLWSFLNPLLTMLVQYLVFSTLFRSAIDHFPVYLISGIIVFSFFTECVTLGMDAIVMNASLITKVAIPKLIFPFSRALSSLINFLISLLPLLLLMLLTGVRVSPALLLLPLMIALLFLFALGVTLVMATLNVFFRDTRFLWSVISLLWTYATPIFYPDTIWPEGLRGIFHLNPMYQLIDFLRQIVIAGIPPTPERLLACGAGAFGMLMIGLVVFRRYEEKFVFHL